MTPLLVSLVFLLLSSSFILYFTFPLCLLSSSLVTVLSYVLIFHFR